MICIECGRKFDENKRFGWNINPKHCSNWCQRAEAIRYLTRFFERDCYNIEKVKTGIIDGIAEGI